MIYSVSCTYCVLKAVSLIGWNRLKYHLHVVVDCHWLDVMDINQYAPQHSVYDWLTKAIKYNTGQTNLLTKLKHKFSESHVKSTYKMFLPMIIVYD